VRDYIRLSGVLLLICAIAAGILGITNNATYAKIQDQVAMAQEEARKQVLPAAESFDALDKATMDKISANPAYNVVLDVYVAKAGGNAAGYAISVAPKGYGGAVQLIVGVDDKGIVQGIKVGTNNETPGLGKNSEKPKFSDQYKGKTWDSAINVIKNGTPKDNEIVAISGSTITSKAVTLGVNQAMAVAKELSGK
jgi:electron transport complex protein RnfG